MYIHNFDPVIFEIGSLAIRWYSMAYILGILIGWWLGKKVFINVSHYLKFKINNEDFDNYITYLIISIIVGGRLGYVIFYNFEFYLSNPLDIIKIWNGGMSFHGGLVGVIIGTYIFAQKNKLPTLFLLDIIAYVSPIGIFFGRIANFINAELVGKTTNAAWGVIFPAFDNMPRHPSQLYEAFLEGLVLFCIMCLFIFKKKYIIGESSFIFLVFYGLFRIISEFFREPDAQIGYLFNFISMGSLLSLLMILSGLILFFLKKNET